MLCPQDLPLSHLADAAGTTLALVPPAHLKQKDVAADAQAGETLEQRSRSFESVQSRHMLRHQSPARMSADALPVVRSSPRLKVSKVRCSPDLMLRGSPCVRAPCIYT